ncbi:hypothetical protein JTE90_003180 [Oedothorax gibbosus]|uniref:Aquaporin n=1 Tax=Oedothorax gibbosus TaxID=931172 RepID=A0AAV6UR31_9ARAC|nr:hypothetical protein JTE90_003180 [Oedothorax gibbosus]
MSLLREAAAEFLGTFVLVLLGNSVTAAIVFSGATGVSPLLGPLGWGLALMSAILITGGVSGAVLNPAVSVAQWSVGKVGWRRALPHMAAQYAGAFMSAIALYAVYFESFAVFDGGDREMPPHKLSTAHIFATFPAEHAGAVTCFVDQVVSTALLMLGLCAIGDARNMAVPKGLQPLVVGLLLTSVIAAFPYNCAAPLNPARDLAPRAFLALAGWGHAVFSLRDYNYFWVPVVGPHVGAVLGAWVYRLLVRWPAEGGDTASYDLPLQNFKPKEDKGSLAQVKSGLE